MPFKQNLITRLQGGIGNQLFQLCAGLSVAKELEKATPVDLLVTGLDELNSVLKFGNKTANQNDLQKVGLGKVGKVSRSLSLRFRRELLIKTERLQIARQNADQAFLERSDWALSDRTKSVYLDGYFQHPSWYESSLVEVTRLIEASLELMPSPEGIENGVVISLRRGDYVRLGWDLPMKYYDSALRLKGPTDSPIWIVGDDDLVIELISEKWRSHGLNILSLPDLGVTSIPRDLALLARAKNVVMSNSTFCWWGVMAGNATMKNGARRIICPSHWLPLAGSECLIQNSWETVDN